MMLRDIALVVFGVTMFGLLYTVITRDKGLENLRRRERQDLRKWRKQHGLRRHEAPPGDTPVPLYPSPSSMPWYAGPSSESVDGFFAALRRMFRPRPKARE
ncbi:MAG: hypothetical protein WAU33_09415 [Candidatus Binataceae bacterium]